MDAFETKAMPGQIKIDEAEGIVECFVAGVGNKDSVGDIVLPGAFTASLQRRKPRVVWGHDWNQPIGKVLDIYEVPPTDRRLPDKMRAAGVGGLFAKVQFNLKAERGREAFANVAFFGTEQEWSIGYKTLDAIYDNARQANLLKEVELYEVSPVLHGANQLTATISIKSDDPDSDDRISSFKKSKWPMFDRTFAEMIKEEHPEIWDAGGNIKGDDQYTILTRIAAEQGGVAKTPSQIDALELREAWVARHEKDFRLPGVIAQIKWLAIGSRGEDHMKGVVREEIKRRNEKKSSKAAQECPSATQSVQVNLTNRQKAIDTAGYGPLNPSQANTNFWSGKARRWDVSPEDARKQTCGNCAAFIKTPEMLDCIKGGLAAGGGLMGAADAMDVVEAGDLGYCEAFDFKCASARTCDAWIGGGPVVQSSAAESEDDDTKGHGWMPGNEEMNDEEQMIAAMRESLAIAQQATGQAEEYGEYEGSDQEVDEIVANAAMGRNAVLARALANEMRTPVRIRVVERNVVVFDVMSEDDTPITMRASWHAEGGQIMLGRPERVRAQVVYLPVEGEGGQAYVGDMSSEYKESEIKAPTPLDAIPQERITGDVLRGYGPRRGNLERLLRYWRPIMRKPGGFRRCRVILADHPELYPLENLCAWLHHETTGLWPNEGCHHPGMKNCRRKLRGVVRGSLWSDSEFNDRLEALKPNAGKKKGMPDPFEDDEEDVVTDEDIAYANKVLNEFIEQEKEFMEYLSDEKNWGHYGDDDEENEVEHEWVMPDNAPEGVVGKKPGGCGCGCSGAGGKGSCMDMPKSVEDSLEALKEKVGRSLNSRNAEKITQAIQLLTEVIGDDSQRTRMQRKENAVVIEAPQSQLFYLRETIDPIVDFYDLDVEIDEDGIRFDFVSRDAEAALQKALLNFSEVETKGIGRRIWGAGKPRNPVLRDGDGDGFFSIRPGAPDRTPVSKLPKTPKAGSDERRLSTTVSPSAVGKKPNRGEDSFNDPTNEFRGRYKTPAQDRLSEESRKPDPGSAKDSARYADEIEERLEQLHKSKIRMDQKLMVAARILREFDRVAKSDLYDSKTKKFLADRRKKFRKFETLDEYARRTEIPLSDHERRMARIRVDADQSTLEGPTEEEVDEALRRRSKPGSDDY